jgi:hypothetical protein
LPTTGIVALHDLLLSHDNIRVIVERLERPDHPEQVEQPDQQEPLEQVERLFLFARPSLE